MVPDALCRRRNACGNCHLCCPADVSPAGDGTSIGNTPLRFSLPALGAEVLHALVGKAGRALQASASHHRGLAFREPNIACLLLWNGKRQMAKREMPCLSRSLSRQSAMCLARVGSKNVLRANAPACLPAHPDSSQACQFAGCSHLHLWRPHLSRRHPSGLFPPIPASARR